MECISIIVTIIACIAGIVSAGAGVYCAVQTHRIKVTAKAIKNDVGGAEANSFIDSFLPFESMVDEFRLKGEEPRKRDVEKLYIECKSLIKEVRKYRGIFSDEVFKRGNRLIETLYAIMQEIRDGHEPDEVDYGAIFEKAIPHLSTTTGLINEIIEAVRNSSRN